MKKIIIDGKDYLMSSSALTQFSYKDETGRSFLNDLQKLVDLKKVDSLEYSIEDLDSVTELLLKIAYVMIKEADGSQVADYKSFLKGINSIYDDSSWINDVITLACTPISRQLHSLK